VVKAIPDGYHTVTPYLTVDDLPRMLEFVQAAFGAKVHEALAGEDGVVRHAEVQLGDSKIMIGQARAEWKGRPGALYLYVEDTDANYHRALAAGAKSIMEPADQFYGDRNAGVEDPLGNYWWIATHVEDMTPEEMQRRMREQGK
jgi:PhnB protein